MNMKDLREKSIRVIDKICPICGASPIFIIPNDIGMCPQCKMSMGVDAWMNTRVLLESPQDWPYVKPVWSQFQCRRMIAPHNEDAE